jgi:hypothetical protein
MVSLVRTRSYGVEEGRTEDAVDQSPAKKRRESEWVRRKAVNDWMSAGVKWRVLRSSSDGADDEEEPDSVDGAWGKCLE